jgi:hypothetical protein
VKVLFGLFLLLVVGFMGAGCASDDIYVPRIPHAAKFEILEYKGKPDNKVFVIAVDPGGNFAYGTAHGKDTLTEAVKEAVEMVELNRESAGVFAKPYIYAVNNEIVHEEMIRRSHRSDELSAVILQKDMAERDLSAVAE